MKPSGWKTYRTRFLVKAKRLSSSLTFTDPLGRQHCGRKGDYLVESFDGVISIAPRQIFEDIYVPMSLPMSLANASVIAEPTLDDIPSRESTTANTSNNKLARRAPMNDRRVSQRRILDRTVNPAHIDRGHIDRRNFEPLEIKEVGLGKPARGRQGLDRNQHPDEVLRANRKLPQPVRERRATPSALRLM